MILDCANGVGATAMTDVINAPEFQQRLNIKTINTDPEPTHLNDGCGAEFVHKDQKLPSNWSAAEDANKKCAAFDGDADR